jgi:hypothetical protein
MQLLPNANNTIHYSFRAVVGVAPNEYQHDFKDFRRTPTT